VFKAAPPAGPGLDVTLKRPQIRYWECFAALPLSEARRLRRRLPGADQPNGPDLSRDRDGIETLYAQRFHLPIGIHGSIRIELVMYRPRNTETPGHVKLEVKGPIGRPRPLGASIRNRMAAFLRYHLHGLEHGDEVRAVKKPARWNDEPLKARHTYGSTQKRLLDLFRQSPVDTMRFDDRANRLKSKYNISRSNARESLRTMRTIGDLNFTSRKGRIKTLRLFNYGTIKLAP